MAAALKEEEYYKNACYLLLTTTGENVCASRQTPAPDYFNRRERLATKAIRAARPPT
jgi:hypothetical protein